MIPLSYPLAIAIITSPCTSTDHLKHLQPVVRALAVEMELMSPWESWADFTEFTAAIQDRHVRLLGAPFIWESWRLPSKSTAQHQLEFIRGYELHLKKWFELEPGRWREYAVVSFEVMDRRRAWELLSEAHKQDWCALARRERLRDLRSMIGAGDFSMGVMPEPIPVWRCVRVD